jgi:hypothetical protein
VSVASVERLPNDHHHSAVKPSRGAGNRVVQEALASHSALIMEAAMRSVGVVVFGFALVSGASATQAQTTVTRQISNEPVETVITQGPTGTVVTRSPMQTNGAPLIYAPAAAETVVNEPMGVPPGTFVPAEPAVTAPVVAQTEIVTSPRRPRRVGSAPIATRYAAAPTRPRVRHVGTTARPPRIAARTAVRTSTARRAVAAPLALAPQQRQIVYRTIARQAVLPAAPVVATQPVVAAPAPSLIPPILQPFTPPILNPPAPVVAQTEVTVTAPPAAEMEVVAPPVATTGYPVTTPAAAASYPVASATYVVGSQLPLTVPLVAVPQEVAAQIPEVALYSYAIVNNRMLLVDPETSTVVADVTQ